MEIIPTVINLIEDTYLNNKNILSSLDPTLFKEDGEYYKLYHCYWISNVKLKNILDMLEVYKELNK